MLMLRIIPLIIAAVISGADETQEAPITVKTVTPENAATARAWTEDEDEAARFIAKTLYGECRGCTQTEQAAVAWCILNRVDSEERYFPDDIVSVITQKYQFAGYREKNPVTAELLGMAYDVMFRWLAEKDGETNCGRVLPAEYCYFVGDGKHNYFTAVWRGRDYWDWTLETPYEN